VARLQAGADFGDYKNTKVLNASKAAVADPDSAGKGLVPFVEENGNWLAQLCRHAIGPGWIPVVRLVQGWVAMSFFAVIHVLA